eukprot:4580513-Pleurochrysis_carterae.AAC.1
MRLAVDMYEMLERGSIRAHKSFLPEGAIFKLQNAETKRIASSSSSKRVVLMSKCVPQQPMRGKSENPAQM